MASQFSGRVTGPLLDGVQRIASLPRLTRRFITMAVDSTLCLLSCYIAFAVRIGGWQLSLERLLELTAVCLGTWFVIAIPSGFYRSLIRFSGVRTILGLFRMVIIYSIPIAFLFLFVGIPTVPRTFGAIQPIVFFGLLLGVRTAVQVALIEVSGRGSERVKRVAIYGAGRSGQQLAQSLAHEAGFEVVSFIDDDERLSGQKIDNVTIHHSRELGALIERLAPDEVLMAAPKMSRFRRREVVESLGSTKVRILPPLGQIAQGRVTVNDLHDLRIDELLGRDPVAPNLVLLCRPSEGKTVLVTGAGGSIGSELCRQITPCRPKRLILFEQSESALFEIERELRAELGSSLGATELVAELGSLSNEASTLRVFERHRPDTVFHAAAYKHVPLVEANPLSGLLNNIWGTVHAVKAAERAGVSTFVLISSDKAVRPTNIMGASKRVCEMILQARAHAAEATIVYAMVRFGNVLGSSGSVVPHFKAQIAKGGPVTVTHRDMTRYFMTIPEAAQLVIQAGAMAAGGEVFLLDMGEPVKIRELAETMIRLSGLEVRDEQSPNGDIAIVETGLRPGEKLFEELLIDNKAMPTMHQRIMRADEPFLPWPDLSERLDQLHEFIVCGDRKGACALVQELVPEYAPDQSGTWAQHDGSPK